MIIIKLQGGIGNQMFQYAFGRSLSLKRKDSLRLDTCFYKNIKSGDTPREFKLNNFNIKANIVETNSFSKSTKFLWKVVNGIGLKIHKDFHVRFHPLFLNMRTKKFIGFFQSYKYFSDYEKEIREDLTLKIQLPEKAIELIEQIKNSASVSIHVRCGDYLTNKENLKNYGVCSPDHYQNAISKIKEKIDKPIFYIFSDNINWVKSNLKTDENFIFVSDNNFDETVELELMSNCKNNIIANGSFSWWGAWLNKNHNKIVIAPRKWTNIANFDTIDLIPDDWIKI
ncbi:MAG: alpha-1,2-fucosyltransferase [Candidatus Taylorbacteria bacterium]|nr:alpha-1,2-fucosyltransferase [Candidatus Taylorbacteria bacterium]